MNIDSIRDGYVIDHIRAGKSMEIYHFLGLDDVDCSVAIIKNVKSRRMGRKDIIKIDEMIPIDLDVLGYIDPNVTVNIISGGKLIEKRRLTLPNRIKGVLVCRNPRCVTMVEPAIEQEFFLADEEKRIYRCAYCEAAYKAKE